jgi:hypothetical protein
MDALSMMFNDLNLSCTLEELKAAVSTLKQRMLPKYATEYKTLIGKLLESNEHGVDVFVVYSKLKWCELDNYLQMVIFTVPWCLLFFVDDNDVQAFMNQEFDGLSPVFAKIMTYFPSPTVPLPAACLTSTE